MRDPLTILQAVTTGEDIVYLMLLVFPLAFMLVFAPSLAFAASALVAMNLLSDWPTTTNPKFQYTTPLIPFLIVATIFGVARFSPGRARGAAIVAAFSGAFFVLAGPTQAVLGYELSPSRDDALREAAGMVPDDAVLSSTQRLGGRLSARRVIYSFPVIRDADWIVVDRRDVWVPELPTAREGFRRTFMNRQFERLERDPRFRVVFRARAGRGVPACLHPRCEVGTALIVAEREQERHAPVRPVQAPSRRRVVALALAALAVVAAVIAAVGPAVHERSVYDWPPTNLPSERPQSAWYAPLLLANRVPAAVEVSVPCRLPPALQLGAQATTILATARDPIRAEGLRIAHVRDTLVVSSGAKRFASVDWPPPATDCPYRVRVAGGELILPGQRVALSSNLPDNMPAVSSLFTELDLAQSGAFRVRVETRTYATSPSFRQSAAVGIATLCSIFALGLVSGIQPRRVGLALRDAARGARRVAGIADAVVISALLAWFVLAPTFVDDGWMSVRQRNFAQIGAFSNYYDSFGANSFLAYWLDWSQHWLAAATDQLIFLRIPSLFALIACWLLCRWCYRRAVGDADTAVARWTLAASFLVLAMAWGMTLRPEPFVALLVVSSLAGALSFAERPRIAPLVFGVTATAFAVSAHPAGLAAVAPLLAVSPQVVRSTRARLLSVRDLTTVAASGVALTIVLVFLDTDLAAWTENQRLFLSTEHLRADWWWEPARYTELIGHTWATPIRHLSVAVLLLSVVAFLIRPRRVRGAGLSLLPARSLAIALSLFVFAPSKAAWHFGALAGLGAVAAAIECARLAADRRSGRRVVLKYVFIAEFVAVVASWAWLMTGNWSGLDLLSTEWRDVLPRFGYSGAPVVPWLALLSVVAVSLAVRLQRRFARRREDPAAVSRRVASWSFTLAAIPLILVTMLTLTVDAVRAPEWNPTRQNLRALIGRAQCGAADVIRVPGAQGEGPVRLASVLRPSGTRTLLDAGIAPYFPCARPAGIRNGVAELPDVQVMWPEKRAPVTMDTESSFGGAGDLYRYRASRLPGELRWLYVLDSRIPGGSIAPVVLAPTDSS